MLVRKVLDKFVKERGPVFHYVMMNEMNERLRKLDHDVRTLSRLGVRHLIGGATGFRNFIFTNGCDLIYDIAQGNISNPNHVYKIVLDGAVQIYETDEDVLAEMEFNVATNFKIDGSEVNEKVASQIDTLRKAFVKMKKEIKMKDKQMYQVGYEKVLEDAATIVRRMEMRVDFLSEFGLNRLPNVIKMKEKGEVNSNLSGVTARRVLALIEFKGKVEWKRSGMTLTTVVKH